MCKTLKAYRRGKHPHCIEFKKVKNIKSVQTLFTENCNYYTTCETCYVCIYITNIFFQAYNMLKYIFPSFTFFWFLLFKSFTSKSIHLRQENQTFVRGCLT